MKVDYKSITQGKLRKYVSKNNQILIDGAHNPLAALAITKYLETFDVGKKNYYDSWNDG